MELIEHGAELQYIVVDKAQIPYAFPIKLIDRTYKLTINYNDDNDFFTIDLETVTGESLCFGEVVRYGKPLFEAFNDERYPLPVIVPLCVTGDDIDTITWENFGGAVKLFMLPRG